VQDNRLGTMFRFWYLFSALADGISSAIAITYTYMYIYFTQLFSSLMHTPSNTLHLTNDFIMA